MHRLRQDHAARLLQLRRGRDDELALLGLEAEAPVDVRVVAELRDLLGRDTVSSTGKLGKWLGTYVARAVGIFNADEVEVPPLEDQEADDGVGVRLDSIVGEDKLNVGVDRAAPRALAVHAGASPVVLVGLVLLERGLG